MVENRTSVMRLLPLVILVGCGKTEAPPPAPPQAANQPQADSAPPDIMRFTFGDSSLTLPAGWSETKREPERLTFRSADSTEQATISTLSFSVAPSFDDFKLICQHRLDAEHQAADDAFVNVTGPSNDGNKYTLLYSGGEKVSRRMFSGYLVLVGKTVFTVYVEAIGVAPERHLATFKAFVTGFRP